MATEKGTAEPPTNLKGMMRTDVFEFEGVWFPHVTSPVILQQLKDFEVREDDLVIVTYPKCGTHWVEEVIQLMTVDGHVDQIVRDVTHTGLIEFKLPNDPSRGSHSIVATKPSPRIYASHLSAKLLPQQMWTKNPKILYLTRNPKDALVSNFRFISANPFLKEPPTFQEAFNAFISEKAFFGNWFNHALEYWDHRDDENVFFLTFEEMKKDLRSVVKRLEKFLGLSITQEGMERILEHSSIEGMKKTYAKIEEDYENGKMYTRAYGIMPFIQKGVSGGWRAHFTDEQRDQMDRMVKERLAGTGLEAHYN